MQTLKVGHVLNDLCAAMWFRIVFQINTFKNMRYSVIHVKCEVFWKTWLSYLLVYFHQILELDSSTAGYLLLAGQITDGLATPIVGIESDRFGIFGRFYGRRKSWHGFGSICVILSFVFIFTGNVFDNNISLVFDSPRLNQVNKHKKNLHRIAQKLLQIMLQWFITFLLL